MITDELLTAFDLSLRAALRHDPVARQHLQQLNNKVLKVKCTFPSITLYLAIIDGHPELSDRTPTTSPNAEVSGSPTDFLKALTSKNSGLAQGLQVRGDSQFVHALQQCLQSLDIDWEGWLADHAGDLAAHQIAQVFRAGHQFSDKTQTQMLNSFKDYLQEELQATPARIELERFYQAVDELRLRSDRLNARISQLETPAPTSKPCQND